MATKTLDPSRLAVGAATQALRYAHDRHDLPTREQRVVDRALELLTGEVVLRENVS